MLLSRCQVPNQAARGRATSGGRLQQACHWRQTRRARWRLRARWAAAGSCAPSGTTTTAAASTSHPPQPSQGSGSASPRSPPQPRPISSDDVQCEASPVAFGVWGAGGGTDDAHALRREHGVEVRPRLGVSVAQGDRWTRARSSSQQTLRACCASHSLVGREVRLAKMRRVCTSMKSRAQRQPHPQGQPLAAGHPHPAGLRHRPHEALLPGGAVPPPGRPAGQEAGGGRHRAQHPRRRLAPPARRGRRLPRSRISARTTSMSATTRPCSAAWSAASRAWAHRQPPAPGFCRVSRSSRFHCTYQEGAPDRSQAREGL